MPRHFDHALLIGIMFLPVAFAAYVCLSPSRFAAWAKVASVIACIAGIAWAVVTLYQPPLSMTRYPFLLAVSIKQTLGGIVLGIVISIVLARPYRRADSGSTRET